MAPSYYITIKEMRPHREAPKRYSRRGWSLPPKVLGHNRVESIAHFLHLDGVTTMIPSIPDDAEIHGTYSVYTYNATIWTINYDATSQQVHDGEDTSEAAGYAGVVESDSEDEDHDEGTVFDEPPEAQMDEDALYQDDWVSMSFNHSENHVSYASRRMQHWRLCVDRWDQPWAKLILPDPYMAPSTTNDPRYGGLIGDLPLLVGLIAISVPPEQMTLKVTESIGATWQFGLDDMLSRGDGWFDGRGVVVTIFANPAESSIQDLRKYECGVNGPILQ